MTAHQETWHWRPEPGWLMLSLLGMTFGGLAGVAYVVAVVAANFGDTGALNGDPGGTLMGFLGLAAFGAVGGAAPGLVGGAAVGCVLTFLVGRDMRGGTASALAFSGAAVTVALLLWLVLPAVPRTVARDHLTLLILASAVAAGLAATWFRGQLAGPS